jgi:hypothetical protein
VTQIDSDYTDDLEGDEDGSGLIANLRKQLKDANKRAKAAEDAAGANSAATRRVAFLDAGIPDTPQTKFFREHYAGDLEPAAVKAAALEHGFIQAEDHTDEVRDIAGMSEDVNGGQAVAALGNVDEFRTEVDAAVAKAPRGKENQAIADVYQRYNRSV